MKQRLIKLSVYCLVLAIGLTACNNKLEEQTKQIYAMDTIMDFTIYAPTNSNVLGEMETEINKLENLFSTTSANSEIYQVNHSTKRQVISDDTDIIISQCLDYYSITNNNFNIAIYPLVELWGFTTKSYKVPTDKEIGNVIKNTNPYNIKINGGNIEVPAEMAIDLGGAAKGYASDKLAKIMRDNGIEHGLINLGGNVYAVGSKPDGKPWKVGVQNPAGEGNVGVLEIKDKAVVTSGTYQRFFEKDGQKYHHIIDPKTGKPADNELDSVTIVSDNGLEADVLSTALFVMGLPKAVDFWESFNSDFDVIFITKDGKIHYTKGLIDSFLPNKGFFAECIEKK